MPNWIIEELEKISCERAYIEHLKMPKSNPSTKSKSDIIMNFRFEIPYDAYIEFWSLGRKVFKLKRKNDILLELIRIVKEKYPHGL